MTEGGMPMSATPYCTRALAAPLAVLALAAAAVPARAGLPGDPAQRAAVVGQPAALLVQPETITLAGPRSRAQAVVTGRYADATVRDLTPFAELSVEPADLAAVDDG